MVVEFRGIVLILSSVILLGCGQSPAGEEAKAKINRDVYACDCGPDYCKDDPRYGPALERKKKELAKEYPSDLVALLDRDGACVARVEMSPDSFSIMTVDLAGDTTTIAWSKDQEEAVRRGLVGGIYEAYYKFNVAHAFKCCGDPEYSDRADYDESLDINTGLAIHCRMVEGNARCD